jgi:hypothetical protein
MLGALGGGNQTATLRLFTLPTHLPCGKNTTYYAQLGFDFLPTMCCQYHALGAQSGALETLKKGNSRSFYAAPRLMAIFCPIETNGKSKNWAPWDTGIRRLGEIRFGNTLVAPFISTEDF